MQLRGPFRNLTFVGDAINRTIYSIVNQARKAKYKQVKITITNTNGLYMIKLCQVLELLHCVHRKCDCWKDDEKDRNDGEDFRSEGALRLLHQIPEFLALPGEWNIFVALEGFVALFLLHMIKFFSKLFFFIVVTS